MPKGGRRIGSGRKRGSVTKRTRQIAVEAAAKGLTPLEYLLMVMRDENQPPDRRDRAAIACAPFIHAKISERRPENDPAPAKPPQVNINIVSIPSGKFLDRKEIEALAINADHPPRPWPPRLEMVESVIDVSSEDQDQPRSPEEAA